MASSLAENITAVLSKLSADGVPEVESNDRALVLTYSAAAFPARCTGDDLALRAMKSLKLGASSMDDVATASKGLVGFVVTYALAK